MYDILRHSHSGLRWLVLIGLIIAIINAFSKKGKQPFTAGDKKISLISMTLVHIQFLIGLILFFISPKVVFSASAMKADILRFFLVEHSVMMLIAVALISIGYSKAKRLNDDAKKFQKIAIFYLIGLLIILAAIPWPFRNLGGTWF